MRVSHYRTWPWSAPPCKHPFLKARETSRHQNNAEGTQKIHIKSLKTLKGSVDRLGDDIFAKTQDIVLMSWKGLENCRTTDNTFHFSTSAVIDCSGSTQYRQRIRHCDFENDLKPSRKHAFYDHPGLFPKTQNHPTVPSMAWSYAVSDDLWNALLVMYTLVDQAPDTLPSYTLHKSATTAPKY